MKRNLTRCLEEENKELERASEEAHSLKFKLAALEEKSQGDENSLQKNPELANVEESRLLEERTENEIRKLKIIHETQMKHLLQEFNRKREHLEKNLEEKNSEFIEFQTRLEEEKCMELKMAREEFEAEKQSLQAQFHTLEAKFIQEKEKLDRFQEVQRCSNSSTLGEDSTREMEPAQKCPPAGLRLISLQIPIQIVTY